LYSIVRAIMHIFLYWPIRLQ